MKLITDLIIENNGEFNVIPQGTNIKPVDPICDVFLANLRIIDKTNTNHDTVEGAQDPSDITGGTYAYHHVKNIEGSIVGLSFIPKTPELETFMKEQGIIDTNGMEEHIFNSDIERDILSKAKLECDDISDNELDIYVQETDDKFVVKINYIVNSSDEVDDGDGPDEPDFDPDAADRYADRYFGD